MVAKADIEKAAKLAAIDLSDQEINKLSDDLQNVMQMIEEMKKVDCQNVEPLASVCEQDTYMSQDEVDEKDLGANLFTNVPGKDAVFAKEIKCFIVPKVVE